MGNTNFPTSLDSYSDKVDNTDDVMAVDYNDPAAAIVAIETKLGVNSSAVATTIDYLLKNAASSNPGHKHTLAQGATDVTASAAEVNTACDGITATAAELNTVADGSTAKNSHTHLLAVGATDVTASAAEINTACDGSTAKNSHVHSGRVVQVVNTQTGAYDSTAVTIPYDDTVPLITEGKEFITATITPGATTNMLLIEAVLNVSQGGGGVYTTAALFQDAGACLAAGWAFVTYTAQIVVKYYMLAGTTSATTFRIRAGANTGTIYLNGLAARKYGGVLMSSLTITEIVP